MAKTRALGADVVLRAAFETTYGTQPSTAASHKQLRFKESNLGAEQPLGYDQLLGNGRNAGDPYYEAITVEGNLIVPIDLRATGFWLKGIFGAPETTEDDDVYTHVFTSGADLPSMAFELGHPKLTSPKFYRHAGAKLGGWQHTLSRSGPVNATIGVIAQGETEHTTTIDATPGSYALSRFNQGSGTIKLGGVALGSVTGGSVNFSNNLEGVPTVRADQMIDGVDEAEATCLGGIDVRFGSSSTLSDAADDKTPVALEYGYSSGNDFLLKFDLPRVFLPKKKREIRGPGGIQASYDWRAAFDDTAGYLLRVTLINDVASY